VRNSEELSDQTCSATPDGAPAGARHHGDDDDDDLLRLDASGCAWWRACELMMVQRSLLVRSYITSYSYIGTAHSQ